MRNVKERIERIKREIVGKVKGVEERKYNVMNEVNEEEGNLERGEIVENGEGMSEVGEEMLGK